MIEIDAGHLSIVKQILRAHIPSAEVRAFGSRVTGKAKPYSDLDLAILSQRPLTVVEMAELRCAFEESDLPYRIDLVDWLTLSPEFRTIVEQAYEIVQVAEGASTRQECGQKL